MRIGMMADAYKPYISGVTNYISLNKRALESWGYEVFVFTLGGDHEVDGERNIVRAPSLLLGKTGFGFNVRYSRAVQRQLAAMDVAHVHHPFISGRLAMRYCRPRGIPIVFTNHTRYDLYAQAYLPMVPGSLSESLLRAYMPKFCAACDLVVAPSAGLLKVLRSFGVQTPVEVIPNGIDLLPFTRAAERRSRAEFGLTESDCVLVFVGRIAPEKNWRFLLEAFAAALTHAENLRLMLVGSGPQLEALHKCAKRMGVAERVRATGGLPYTAIPGILAMADAFVTASTTEVHPLSLIEAMAAGLPAVGIASPGIEDTIRDGENGILCRNGRDEFARALIRLARDGDVRRRLGAGAAESAQQYDIQRTTSIMLEHYWQLVESRRSPKP